MLWIIYSMVIKRSSLLEGGMNYILWVLIYGIGGQGGDINELWDAWVSSLAIGLAQWFGSFETWLRELYL